eukprot:scaffold7033_cov257-Pinguiococcus_pyrenoidosus.AAC.20
MQKRTKKGGSDKVAKRGLRRLQDLESRAQSRAINANLERVLAAKAVQNGERLLRPDMKSKGKELAKEIRRQALTRKKSRIEEKLEQAKQKLAQKQRED